MPHTRDAALDFIRTQGLIAVVRADAGADQLIRVVQAVAEGGVRCIELTMTSPNALAVLALAVRELEGEDVLLGMGTVLDAETARLAIGAGAAYVVTPVVSIGVVETARRDGVPVMCGAFTPTEILTAWQAGSDMVKVFPSEVGGPGYIKAIKGPLPQIPLVPTGGVTLDNIEAFFKAGAAALGVGGNLVSKELVAEEHYAGLTANARAFASAVARARG